MIEPQRQSISAIVFWLSVAALCGYGAVWTVMQKVQTNEDQESWEQHPGIVIASSASLQIGGEYSSNKIRTAVDYEYEVDGVLYLNDQEWTTACEFSCRSKEEEQERKYSPGSPLAIFVDPDDNANGLINPWSGGGGISGEWGQPVALVLAFASIGSVIAIFSGTDLPWRKLQK